MGHSSESGATSAIENNESAKSNKNCSLRVENGDIKVSDPEDESQCVTKKQHLCPYIDCNKRFSRPWRLSAHLSTHTGKLPYMCSFEGCGKAYSSTCHLKRHIISRHEPNKHETSFRCPFPGCDIEMKNQWNIKKHYKSKHEPKAFACTQCTESFKKHSQLKVHMYEHTGLPPIHCSKCNAGFLKSCDLNRHMRGHKSHKCKVSECGQTFETWTLLRKHVALEHPKEFTCEHCKKVFYNKGQLRLHMVAHTDKSEREVILCPYRNCGRYYFEKKNLNQHIRSNHHRKTFPCTFPGCDRQLRSQATLKAHLKLHNPKGPMPNKRKKPRKKRCDAGIHKRSMAVKLSGLHLKYSDEKKLTKEILNAFVINDTHLETKAQTLVTEESQVEDGTSNLIK